MFKYYEKKIELEAMNGQSGIIKIRYNKIFKTFQAKIYFRNKCVSRVKKKVENRSGADDLALITSEDVTYLKEGRHYRMIGMDRYTCAYDGKDCFLGKTHMYNLSDIYANGNIEKILAKEKLKKNGL